MSTEQPHLITRASLENPLYYLRNLQTVIDWVTGHHCDLLTEAELQQLQLLRNLPDSAQALLARLIMRKGCLFRCDALKYDEIPALSEVIDILETNGWLQCDPVLAAADVFQLCRRDEILDLLEARQSPCPRSSRKADLLEPLVALEMHNGKVPMSQWRVDGSVAVIALQRTNLITRVQLMFFGNLYQDWSEFVLAELGYQHYETVVFAPASRAFRSRDEIDHYLALHDCEAQLYAGLELVEVVALCPAASDNPWLAHRRQRLLYRLGQHAERSDNAALASALYRESKLDDAWVRFFRVQEKYSASPALLLQELDGIVDRITQPEAKLHLARVRHRLMRKCGQSSTPPRQSAVPTRTLQITRCSQRVEVATLAALTSDNNLAGTYCENSLFTGLFGLLFWPVLFAPVAGAFFHPFQSGPADLFRPDFVKRRQRDINDRLSLLESGDYQQEIWHYWNEKRGISCSLVHWGVLSEDVVKQALECIPARDLRVVFEHLLRDLRRHRRGMPDLVIFDPDSSNYELIEVKGPGDRLQDHQRLWIGQMLEHGLPISVADVTWADAT